MNKMIYITIIEVELKNKIKGAFQGEHRDALIELAEIFSATISQFLKEMFLRNTTSNSNIIQLRLLYISLAVFTKKISLDSDITWLL